MAKIKVLHVIAERNIGSAGQQLLVLCCNSSPVFELHALIPKDSELNPLLKALKIPCTLYEANHNTSKAELKAIMREIKKISPDIVHTHATFNGRISIRPIAKFKRVHSQHVVEECGFFARLANGSLNLRAIAASEAARKALLKMGVSDAKIRVVYDGVNAAQDYTNARAELRKQFDIPEGAFVAACITELTKDCAYLLDTAKELPYNVIVLIARANGADDYKTLLEARTENENLQNVRILPNIEDIDKILAITDVQISLPQSPGVIPHSVLCGMSAGKPTISSVFDKYVVENDMNGLIIAPNDQGALDDAITKLKDDYELYERLSEGAKRRYNERFTAAGMVAKLETIYQELGV